MHNITLSMYLNNTILVSKNTNENHKHRMPTFYDFRLQLLNDISRFLENGSLFFKENEKLYQFRW